MESIQTGLEDIVLELKEVSKSFPKVLANDSVSLKISRGEIHCLLGENGAGKTTLAECIYGYYQPDKGEIFFKGERVNLSSPNEAISLGIGMVHQHFVLIEPLTVIENIVLGTDTLKPFDDLKQAEERVHSLCNEYGVNLNLRSKIYQLSVGEQQWVEIIKTLYLGINLLILDEPTAVLTPQESKMLFSILMKMKRGGLAIIFITHKLNEVMEVSDRVTVLRKGKLVDTIETNQTTKSDLAKMMVGRDVIFNIKREKKKIGSTILQVKNLKVENDAHQEVLKGISFTIKQGEILGLAGVAGNGQNELFEVLIGYKKATDGEIYIRDKNIINQSIQLIMNQGVCYIPDDRIKKGIIPDFPVYANIIIGRHKSSKFCRWIFMNSRNIRSLAKEYVSKYDIVTPSIDQPMRFLSGGNLQKVILARELEQSPSVILANQPTRGLDVGVIEYIHQKLLEKTREGAGILLASEDLEELLNLSDRIAVIYKGEILGNFDIEEVSLEKIGLLMGGVGVE